MYVYISPDKEKKAEILEYVKWKKWEKINCTNTNNFVYFSLKKRTTKERAVNDK